MTRAGSRSSQGCWRGWDKGWRDRLSEQAHQADRAQVSMTRSTPARPGIFTVELRRSLVMGP